MRRLPAPGALALLLATVAAVGLLAPVGFQDVSRLGLTQSLVERGTLRIDRFVDQTGDSSRFGGHYYSDKAPGVSFLAVPPFALVSAAGAAPDDGVWHRRVSLWVLRLLTGGVFFVLALLLVRRLADRFAAGFGAAAAATFGAATLAFPLAATVFGHLAAGVLGLAAFLLLYGPASHRREVAAGVCLGVAVLFEYQAALIVLILAGYLFATRRRRAVVRLVAGGLPAVGALGAYDAIAFGSPFHLSYRYVTTFGVQQSKHFFGISVPHPSILRAILLDQQRGLLLTSPVLLAAVAGLVLVWRRGSRAEAATCLAVGAAFLLLNAGYFDYWGGFVGPRFFAPALPFLAAGLGPAFARWPRTTATLAVASVYGVLHLALAWAGSAETWRLWAGGTLTWFLASVPRAAVADILLALGLGALALALAAAYAGRDRPKTTGAARTSTANAKK